MLQNKLTRAQYLDEVTWTTKSWLGLQKQRISVVLHTAIAEQIVNELACGGGGRVHGASASPPSQESQTRRHTTPYNCVMTSLPYVAGAAFVAVLL